MAPYMSHKKMFWCVKNVDVARLDTYLSKLIYMILCVHPTSSNRRFFWNQHLNPIVLGVPQTILNLLRIFGFMDIYLWIFIYGYLWIFIDIYLF